MVTHTAPECLEHSNPNMSAEFALEARKTKGTPTCQLRLCPACQPSLRLKRKINSTPASLVSALSALADIVLPCVQFVTHGPGLKCDSPPGLLDPAQNSQRPRWNLGAQKHCRLPATPADRTCGADLAPATHAGDPPCAMPTDVAKSTPVDLVLRPCSTARVPLCGLSPHKSISQRLLHCHRNHNLHSGFGSQTLRVHRELFLLWRILLPLPVAPLRRALIVLLNWSGLSW